MSRDFWQQHYLARNLTWDKGEASPGLVDFLAAHPEIVRRRKAKRDLRREKRNLEAAVAAGDGERFGAHAVAALRIAVAPHWRATSRILAPTR